jgi:alpha/beta superfamily hydrolase
MNTPVLIACLEALSALSMRNSELIAKFMFGDYIGSFILRYSEEREIALLGLHILQ